MRNSLSPVGRRDVVTAPSGHRTVKVAGVVPSGAEKVKDGGAWDR